jgi:threonine synthase
MKLYSTNNPSHTVTLKEAIFKSLPEDNGLYMPTIIPQLPAIFLKQLPKYSFQAIGFEVCKSLFQGIIPDHEIAYGPGIRLMFALTCASLDSSNSCSR